MMIQVLLAQANNDRVAVSIICLRLGCSFFVVGVPNKASSFSSLPGKFLLRDS
jgi:hypothetical protein